MLASQVCLRSQGINRRGFGGSGGGYAAQGVAFPRDAAVIGGRRCRRWRSLVVKAASGRKVYRQSQGQSPLSGNVANQAASFIVPAGSFIVVTFGTKLCLPCCHFQTGYLNWRSNGISFLKVTELLSMFDRGNFYKDIVFSQKINLDMLFPHLRKTLIET